MFRLKSVGTKRHSAKKRDNPVFIQMYGYSNYISMQRGSYRVDNRSDCLETRNIYSEKKTMIVVTTLC